MDPIERKALLIMAAIGLAEIAALAAAVAGSSGSTIQRLITVGPAVGWLAGIATAILFIVLTMRRLPLIKERALELSYLKLAGLVFGLLAGIAEELWYRKIPMDALSRAHHGWVVQILAAAILFGAAHGVWGLFARKWRSALAAMSATGALGAALAIVYLVSNRHVAPCIWAHAGINVVLEPWLLIAVLNLSRARATRPELESAKSEPSRQLAPPGERVK